MDQGLFDRIAKSFARQGAMATLGATLERVAPGEVDLILPFGDHLTQQHGFLHAGMVTAVMDSAAGYAAYSLMPEGAGVLTVEFKTSLMAPAKGDRFRMQGRVIKPGRSIMFTETRAYVVGDDGANDREIARLSASMMVVQGRDNVVG